jgi:hypothetical protein
MGDKRNTFQLAIVSDSHSSYAICMYEKIEWLKGQVSERPTNKLFNKIVQGKFVHVPDLAPQAGFVHKDGRHQTIVTSATDEMLNITRYVQFTHSFVIL